MKKIIRYFHLITIFTIFISFESLSQKRTFPTSVSIAGGGTICQFGSATAITIPTIPTAVCGNGGNQNVSHTTTIYSNAVNSTVGGTPVATLTNTSFSTNSTFVPTTNVCGTTFYYAEVTWLADNCAAAGSFTSSTVSLTVDCTCFAPNTDQSITTCGLTWYDSGGASGNYSNNETYTVTFCPSTAGEIIVVDFNNFDAQGAGGTCNDMLDIWQAAVQGASGTQDDRICGNTGAVRFVSTSPDGCITFEFRSDASTRRAGWDANVFCATPCTNPTAQLNDASMISVCPSTALNSVPNSNIISVDASSSTPGAGFALTSYIWEWGDGTSTTTATSSTTHTYPSNSEIYVLKLRVADDNTDVNATGCLSTNSVTKVIRILPEPDFTGTSSSPIAVNCGSNQNLVGILGSQTQTEFVPNPIVGTTILPDGSGVPFESTMDFSGYFTPGATMSAGCYPTVCFDIEHSYSQDLSIELVAPDGTSVIIFNEVQNGANGVGASVFGSCVNSSDLTPVVPGCGAQYCVVNSGGASWTGGAAVRTSAPATGSCTWTGACESTGAYYIPQTYNSSFSFAALNGVPLNGVWTLRITDNLAQDNGVLFGWSLNFPASCFKPLETVTPTISTLDWSHTGTGPAVPVQSTTSSVVTDPGPDACQNAGTCVGNQLNNNITVGAFNTAGSFDYILTGTDQFGCIFENIVTINVACALNATLNGAVSLCGSNSTNLTFSGTPNATVTYNINGGGNLTIVLDAAGLATLNTGVLAATTNYNLISVTDGITTTALSETETVTILPLPVADAPINVVACDSYTLPALTVGNYFTATNGGGTAHFAGDIINSNTTMFVFAQTLTVPNCTDENSFTITINITPSFAIAKTDPTFCNAIDGTITISGLISNTSYLITYDDDAVAVGPNTIISDNNGEILISGLNAGTYDNFIISLNACPGTNLVGVSLNNPLSPNVNDLSNQTLCSPSTFVLPIITGTNLTGNEAYYSGANGTGTQFVPGDIISSTATLFIYDVNGVCSDQENFTVTVNSLPTVSAVNGGNTYCAGDVIANITANVTGTGPWTIDFTLDGVAQSVSGPTSPISLGNAAGVYVVTNVSDANCTNSAIGTQTISVNILPTVSSLVGGNSYCVGDVISNISANLTGTGPWTIDYTLDGVAQSISSPTSPISLGNAAGVYVVTNVTDANCTNSAVGTQTITINSLPTVSSVSGGNTYCTGDIISNINTAVTGTGPWTVDFTLDGVAQNASGLVSPISLGFAAGVYIVTNVSDANCTNSAIGSQTITINPSPTVSSVLGGNSYCVGDVISNISANLTGTGPWTIDYTLDGVAQSISSPTSPISLGNAAGVYVATNVSDANCTNTAIGTQTITVNPLPTVSSVLGGNTYCAGDVISNITANVTGTGPWTIDFTLNGAAQSVTGPTSPISLGNAAGVYVVTNVSDANCTNSAIGTQTISFNTLPTLTSLSGGNTYCVGAVTSNITANVTGTGPWTIDFTLDGAAQSVSGATSPISLGNASGVYVVTNVSDANCTNTASGTQTITINPLPTVSSVLGGNTYCAGDVISNITANVTGAGPWTVDFTLNGVAQSVSGATSPISLGNAAGVYVVTNVTDAACSNTAAGSQSIVVNVIPSSPIVSNDTSYCSYESFINMTATPSSGGTINWYSDNNLSNLLASGTSLLPSNTIGITNYFISQTISGCESLPASIGITVNACELIIPTAFTPDLDGINDTWHIENLNLYFPTCKVTIYNRWGSLLFESDGYATEWKGEYNNEQLPVGSYYFIVDFNDGKTEAQNGTVSIIRNK